LLHDHGLDPTRDVTVRSLASFNSAILAVVNGEAAAAVTAPTALNQMPEATRASVRTIAASPAVPPLMYLASPAVPAAEVEAVQRALLAFGAEPGGREFFKRTGFDGYAPLTTDELRALDPYVAGLKRQLATH
jgi:ABC-type phosphate/phosphonate transport system substrate-binding protein